ncbi:FG-GAP repeat domain-containing protein [Tenacibaculum xiamenense]|uniref:FG-GAP repeat domain-containing protein n=1 Tax=Tenacibaculum xiamenense TaxID=1261553 RepID=UPI003892DC78
MNKIKNIKVRGGNLLAFKELTKNRLLFLSCLLTTSFLSLFGQSNQFSGDFNGDGNYDIGVYLVEEGNFIIKYGTGVGSFSGQTVFSWGSFPNGKVFTGDFNGDGKWDIGLYNPNGLGNWYIQYNTGSGTFGNQTSFNWGPFGLDGNNGVPYTGDFNGDGKWDIGLYNPNLKGEWFIKYGSGSGSFDNQTVFAWGVFPNGKVFTGDFNGDSKWDIGLYNPNGLGNWYILYNTGGGAFGNQTAFNWGVFSNNNPFTGDFNNDGKGDIGFYNPNNMYNWYIQYGHGTGGFGNQTAWHGGDPKKDWNPCCSNNDFVLSPNSGYFLEQSNSTENLRKAMCISKTSPKSAPEYSGDSLVAYQWISNKLYPGSNGDIRSFYKAVNISWGSVIWPSYDKTSCNCGSKEIFESVKKELQKEIQAVADIGALFTSLSTYYINPLFISKGNVVSSVVANVNLPGTTNATISTGEVVEKTIFSFAQSAFEIGLGDENPYAPLVLSALFNLSRTSNGGNISDKLDVAIANIETKLKDTFKETITQISTLRDLIMNDYSVYMKLGLYSAGISEDQLTKMVKSSSKAYERQLYTDLIPLACNIVFYDPGDTHLGGGGHTYGLPSTNYAKPSKTVNQIVYKHNAGWPWNSSSYFTTNTQLLTSYVIFNDGDAITGILDANREMSLPFYQAVFDKLGFTYDELLALPGMVTYYQCSLCQTDDGCNTKCRSASSRGD